MSRIERYRRLPARAGGGELDLLVAEGPIARMVGLLAERELPPRVALVIPRCASVHCVGMRFAIDVAFVRWPPPADTVDVLAVAHGVRPWRFARVRRREHGLPRREVGAIELAAGEAASLGLEAGASLTLAGPGRAS